jgi:aminocarboxymuconate-semialdehyde decarboxylase
MAAPKLLVDVHTHVYLPRYANVLRSRTIAPRILTRSSGPEGKSEERLLILDNEPSGGRPVGAQVLPIRVSQRCDAEVLT